MSSRGLVHDERRSFRAWFAVLSLAFGAVTVWAVVDELHVRRPWKAHQADYQELVAARGDAPPSIAVRQVVNPDLDLIDRCQSCHLGANDPRMDGDEVPPELRTHSDLDRLLGHHPPERFGCTSCHEGQGLALTAGTAHGEDDHYWKRPLLRGQYVQASCAPCHPASGELAGAPLWAEGRALYQGLRCWSCHVTSEDDDAIRGRPAPSLRRVASKLRPGYLLDWIRSPVSRRSGERMPQFWPGADGDPALARTRAEESLALAAYLLEVSEPFPAAEAAPDEAPERAAEGRQLFDRLGCRGCHVVGVEGQDEVMLDEPLPEEASDAWGAFGEDEEEDEDEGGGEEDAWAAFEGDEDDEAEGDGEGGDEDAAAAAPSGSVDPLDAPLGFGPTLGKVGRRTTFPFVYGWLRGPTGYWEHATMPDLRLSEAEATAIGSWLGSLGADEAPATPHELEAPRDPALVDRGRALITGYGCNGCHDIPGFEGETAPGPDLLDYGTKDPHDMDFGRDDLPRSERTWERFTETKIAAPRSLARPEIVLTMPDFRLNPGEVRALSVYLRSLRAGVRVPAEYVHQPSVPADVRAGGLIVEQRGCGGCHVLDGAEPAVARFYAQPHLRAPPLDGVAAKLQPQFFFDFLLRPRPLRPWLDMRMPTFSFAPDEIRALLAWFARRDEVEVPLRPLLRGQLSAERAAAGADLFTRLKCVSCHLLDADLGVESAEMAPDLGLARQRLDPTWVRSFLVDPGALIPQTKMPQFFPDGQTPFPDLLGGDTEAQMDLLVDHLMNLGLQPVGGAPPAAAPAPAAAPEPPSEATP